MMNGNGKNNNLETNSTHNREELPASSPSKRGKINNTFAGDADNVQSSMRPVVSNPKIEINNSTLLFGELFIQRIKLETMEKAEKIDKLEKILNKNERQRKIEKMRQQGMSNEEIQRVNDEIYYKNGGSHRKRRNVKRSLSPLAIPLIEMNGNDMAWSPVNNDNNNKYNNRRSRSNSPVQQRRRQRHRSTSPKSSLSLKSSSQEKNVEEWIDTEDAEDLTPYEKHQRVERIHTVTILDAIEKEQRREEVRLTNIQREKNPKDKIRLEELYKLERKQAKEKIENMKEDSYIIIEHSKKELHNIESIHQMFLKRAKSQAEQEHRKATARLAAKEQRKQYHNQLNLNQPYSLPSFIENVGPESCSTGNSITLSELDQKIQNQKLKVGKVKDGTIQVPLPKWRDEANKAKARFSNKLKKIPTKKRGKRLRRHNKKLIDIAPHKAKELSAVTQYRRKEEMHNKQLLEMIMKEQKREKGRQRNLLQASTDEEREKLKKLYTHQRKNAQRRIEYVDKDRKMLLEKHYNELILGLEAERKLKIKANKPFLELAKLQLLEIVRKARLTTGAKVTVDKVFNRTMNMLKARVYLRKVAGLALKKHNARLALENYAKKARIIIWEQCIKRLFDVGYSCTRIIDDTEYHLQIHPSKSTWYKGMLEVLATDIFLGAPFGLVKVQIPM
jgi:hypothetical protein